MRPTLKLMIPLVHPWAESFSSAQHYEELRDVSGTLTISGVTQTIRLVGHGRPSYERHSDGSYVSTQWQAFPVGRQVGP